MELREQRLVIVLADISGYTQFMIDNQLAAAHGQMCITALIEALLGIVDIPLKLQEIEGDGIFLYAEDPGDEAQWQDVLAQVQSKLLRFFEVFLAATIAGVDGTPCKCAICRNADLLKLKVIVHAGRALFHPIAGRTQISGSDVILAHRLLKNSVPSHEYLLMTEAAYRQLGTSMSATFESRSERYDGFGEVPVRVYYVGPVRDRARETLYFMAPEAITTAARGYVRWVLGGQLRAIARQYRDPIVPRPWWRRTLFVACAGVALTFQFLAAFWTVPRKLIRTAEQRRQQSTAPTRRNTAT